MSDKGNISDGYHTFNELYFHRMVLFAALVQLFQHAHCGNAWKSKKHHDGTMDDGWFIVGLDSGVGQITYHYDIKYWDLFNCPEMEFAPEWDGHTPEDACIRIAKLCNVPETVITDLELNYPAQDKLSLTEKVENAVRQAWNF